MKRFCADIILDDIEISEIVRFYSKLDSETLGLLEMDLDTIMSAIFITCVRNETGEVVGIAGYTRAYGIIPNSFDVVASGEQGKGYGNKLHQQRREYISKHYSLEIGAINNPEKHQASVALEYKHGMTKFREFHGKAYFCKAYSLFGRLLCSTLPFIYPIMPYLYGLATGRIWRDAYRWYRYNRCPRCRVILLEDDKCDHCGWYKP